MLVLADTHVHLYDCYDLNKAFASAFENLDGLVKLESGDALADKAFLALFLTEKKDCHFFNKLKSGSLHPDGNDYVIEQCSENNVLLVRNRQGKALYLFAGRQIVTSERLEVLALTTDLDISDGGSICDIIKQIISGGGVPVLPWAPGKWFGHRGEIVSSLLESASPAQLLVGDTSMRPLGWGVPYIMKEAARKGFKIVAGTDPFPFEGQENLIGKYGISFSAEFDLQRPVSELRRLLTSPGVSISLAGRRDCPFTVARRLLLNSRKKAG